MGLFFDGVLMDFGQGDAMREFFEELREFVFLVCLILGWRDGDEGYGNRGCSWRVFELELIADRLWGIGSLS